MPEQPDNADIRLHWIAYEKLMKYTKGQLCTSRLFKPKNAFCSQVEKFAWRQYIPLLMVGFTKIRKAARLAGVTLHPLPAALAAAHGQQMLKKD